MGVRSFLPSTVLIEPTNMCHLGCSFCEANCTVNKGLKRREILPEDLDVMLVQIQPYITNVVFQGDCAPTLNRYLPELVSVAPKYTTSIAVVTNGTRLTDDPTRRLIANGMTSRTVVLIDPQGNSQCINEPKQVHDYRYPETELPQLFARSSLAYFSTQSWCRYLAAYARSIGKTVAVDVQAIVDVDDYHRDFLVAADIVLLSTERLSMHSHELIKKLWSDFDVSVVVATHGEHGATLVVRSAQTIVYQPAFQLGPVIDKTGAGDAFCAGFLAAVAAQQPFHTALTWAQLTAATKIMHNGSTNGIPSLAELEALAGLQAQPA
jgi:hypothetical protein